MENIDNKIIIYQTADGQTAIDVRLENETVWLNTNQMAMLFDREESNIRRHVTNVFKEGELERENNVHFLHVNGVKKPVPYYTLDVIISVGYRVKSQRGTQFRQWANKVLKDYLVKGYAVNERIQQQPHPLPRGWQQAHSRQHPCGSHADDCRKPPRGEGRDGKSGRKPH